MNLTKLELGVTSVERVIADVHNSLEFLTYIALAGLILLTLILWRIW